MTQTLKPCPFCGSAAKATSMGTTASTVMCENLHLISLFASKDKAVEVWNTRPAPAATDTGLVRYDLSMFGNGIVEMGGGAYVLSDQAEELLAAERAENGKLEADNAELVADYDFMRKSRKKWKERAEKAEAKLAAAEKALECFLVAYGEDYNLHGAAIEARAVLEGKS